MDGGGKRDFKRFLFKKFRVPTPVLMNKDLYHFLEVIVIASVLFIATVFFLIQGASGPQGGAMGSM